MLKLIPTLLGIALGFLGYVRDGEVLQVSAQPVVRIAPANFIPGQDKAFIHAENSKADLILHNDFIGAINDIEIYADYIDILQDINHDLGPQTWSCLWNGNYLPIASSTSMKPATEHKFMYDFNRMYQASLDYRRKVSITDHVSILRIKVSFRKKVDKTPHNATLLYRILDNQTLVDLNGFPWLSNMDKQEVVGIIKSRDIIDPQPEKCVHDLMKTEDMAPVRS